MTLLNIPLRGLAHAVRKLGQRVTFGSPYPHRVDIIVNKMSDPGTGGVFLVLCLRHLWIWAKLLRRFAKDRNEDAFAELVSRHIDLVYSAARRQVRDSSLADDLTQMVFITLARRAGDLKPHVPLDAWLLKVTYFAACNARRDRDRRTKYEREAAVMQDPVIDRIADDDWAQIGKHLDQELADLREIERNLISLRFMRGLPLKEVAAILGMAENSAGKRISRVLEKLRGRLMRKGVTVPAASFAALLGARAIGQAPSVLAGTIAQTALSSASPGVSVGFGTWFFATGTMMWAAAVVLAAALVTTIAIFTTHWRAAGIVGSTAVAAPAAPSAPLSALPATAPANYVFAKRALPRATYFADASRTVFPAGLFKEIDENRRPRGWDDLSAFDSGNAQISSSTLNWLLLTNDNLGNTVTVRTLVPVQPTWKTLAVLARFQQMNLVISSNGDAGIGLGFVDSTARQIGPGTFVTPYRGANFPTYTRAIGTTLTVPPNVTGLVVSVQMTRATGIMETGHIVVMPVDKTRDVDPAQVIALHTAIERGNVARVKQMIAADRRLLESRNLDYDGGTPLIDAAWRDRADVIDALIAMGADMNAGDITVVLRPDGWTAADWAAYWGSVNALKELLASSDETPRVLMPIVQLGERTHENQPPRYGHPEDYAGCMNLLNSAVTTQPTTMPAVDPMKGIFGFRVDP